VSGRVAEQSEQKLMGHLRNPDSLAE